MESGTPTALTEKVIAMSTFSNALIALSKGIPVRRKGWIQDNWHLALKTAKETSFRADCLVRVTTDGELPWGVTTASDINATDWEHNQGTSLVDYGTPEAGTCAAAVADLLAGKTIRRNPWKEGMHVKLEEGALMLVINENVQVPYVFGPEEHVATDFAVA